MKTQVWPLIPPLNKNTNYITEIVPHITRNLQEAYRNAKTMHVSCWNLQNSDKITTLGFWSSLQSKTILYLSVSNQIT